jgi:hypothetical protein
MVERFSASMDSLTWSHEVLKVFWLVGACCGEHFVVFVNQLT